jgi:hypothetical protein
MSEIIGGMYDAVNKAKRDFLVLAFFMALFALALFLPATQTIEALAIGSMAAICLVYSRAKFKKVV